MIELEILVEILDSYEKANTILSQFEHVKNSIIIDKYFYDPLRQNLKPNALGKTFECLRIRSCENEDKITYKQDIYKNDIWQYSNESEISIEDANVMQQILDNLGLKQLLEINNNREYYKYGNYEIVLENVKDLGLFMEVEYKGNLDASQISNKRKEIDLFISSLGLRTSSEINAGKPELFIKKHKLFF